jgi:hypothetical protein
VNLRNFSSFNHHNVKLLGNLAINQINSGHSFVETEQSAWAI